MVGWIHCFGLKVCENNTVQEAVTEAAFLSPGNGGRKEGQEQAPVGFIIPTLLWSLPISPGPPTPQILDFFFIIVTYVWVCMYEYCLLNLLSAAHTCMGVGLATWAWITYGGAHPLLLLSASTVGRSLSRCGVCEAFPFKPACQLVVLLCRSCLGSHIVEILWEFCFFSIPIVFLLVLWLWLTHRLSLDILLHHSTHVMAEGSGKPGFFSSWGFYLNQIIK